MFFVRIVNGLGLYSVDKTSCTGCNFVVRLLREELQLLQEPGSYVGEVVKVMGKNKVLVKVSDYRKVISVFLEDLATSYIHIPVCVICTKLPILVTKWICRWRFSVVRCIVQNGFYFSTRVTGRIDNIIYVVKRICGR